MSVLHAWVVLSSLVGPSFPQPVEEVIQELRKNRAHTAEVEWILHHYGDLNDGLAERVLTQTVDGTVLESNRGDENGFHPWRFHKAPPRNVELSPEELTEYAWSRESSAGTDRILLRDQRLWGIQKVERPITSRVGPIGFWHERLPVEFDGIGLAAGFPSSATNPFGIPDIWFEEFESAETLQAYQGGLRTLTADFGGNKRLRWYFDDRRGGQPVRAEFYRNDELVYLSETEVIEKNGRWFPKSVSFYEGDFLQPAKLIEVTKSSFNEPWHKQNIGPEDLGMLYGTQCWTEQGLEFWSGTELLSQEEYDELVYVYDVPPDPKIIEILADAFEKTPEEYLKEIRAIGKQWREKYFRKHGEEPWLVTAKPAEEKDPWDEHVEEFLNKHKLPKPAVELVKKRLEWSKKIRDVHRRRNRVKMEEAKRKSDQRKLDHYGQREERIFRDFLVRPLEEIAKKAEKLPANPELKD